MLYLSILYVIPRVFIPKSSAAFVLLPWAISRAFKMYNFSKDSKWLVRSKPDSGMKEQFAHGTCDVLKSHNSYAYPSVSDWHVHPWDAGQTTVSCSSSCFTFSTLKDVSNLPEICQNVLGFARESPRALLEHCLQGSRLWKQTPKVICTKWLRLAAACHIWQGARKRKLNKKIKAFAKQNTK